MDWFKFGKAAYIAQLILLSLFYLSINFFAVYKWH